MTDFDRNIRTLIICFALAIMALIPLRFAEINNNITNISGSQVLGETVDQENEVILPNADLDLSN